MAVIGFRNEKDLARFLSTLGHDLFKAAAKADMFAYKDLLRSFSLGKASMVFIERMMGIENLTEATSVALKTAGLAAWWTAVKHTQVELSVDEDQLRSEIASLPDVPIEALALTTPAANKLAQGLRKLVDKHCQDLTDTLRRRVLARWDNLFPLEFHKLLEVRNVVFKPLNDELAQQSYQEQRKLFARETHRRHVIAKYHERVMDNTFGMHLADIYQAPAFAIHRKCLQRDTDEMFVTVPDAPEDLHGALLRLLAGNTLVEHVHWTRIALLLGGPGQGKSSFCKRLAVDAQDRFADRPVYTVLLRHLRDFVDLPRNPLKVLQADVDHHYPGEAAPDFHRCLLILDGLDELVMRGDFRQEQVDKFLRELDRQCEDHQDMRVFITSRYGVTNPDEWPARDVLVLQLKPFDLALQQRWLQAYRAFDGQTTLDEARLKAIHADTQAEHLRELLGQPILLYMVAQSHIDLSVGTSRASIYDQLFTTLIERKWDKGQLEATRIWQDKSSIRRALQDVAMAIFQTGETFASREDLEAALREKAWWRRLSEQGWRNPLDGLMVAFYLQEIAQADRYAVEFLHKSLMEYLVAEKILRLLQQHFGPDTDATADDQLRKLNRWFGQSCLPLEVQRHFADIASVMEKQDKDDLAAEMAGYLGRFLERQFLAVLPSLKPIYSALNTFYGYWHCMQALQPVNRFTDQNRQKLFNLFGQFVTSTDVVM